MKSLYNVPKDRSFFDVYATLAKSVNHSGYFAQIVSAATEVGIIYSLARNALIDFFPEYADVFAIIVAIIGTAVIEIGLRLTTPHSVDAILYSRFNGLYKAMSIAIFILTAVLLGTSGYLSFSNSGEIVENLTPDAEQISTAIPDSIYLAEIAAAKEQFRNDTALINANYSSLINSTATAYKAKIEAAKSELRKWQDKERTSGRNYTTYKANAEIKKAEVIAERDGIISQYKADQADEIATVKANFTTLMNEARSIKKAALADIKDTNKKAKDDRATTVANYGGGLGWFTIVCLFLFVASVVLDRIHKKGSGIEEKVQLSQYDISPSAWSEFVFALNERVGYNLRSWIFDFAAATPPPPLPVNSGELYDQSELTDNITKLKTEAVEDDSNVITLPRRRRIGFYTDDNSSTFYSTPNTKANHAKKSHETEELREIKQRLKFYKKRLGSHQQKAIVQEKKKGKATRRTLDAIANNQRWVEHYTNLLNQSK